MKRAMMAVMVLGIAAVMAVGEEVPSVNTVGFIKTTVGAGGWSIVSIPFSRLDDEVEVALPQLLPEVPANTRAWFYRDGAWDSATYYDGLGWFPADDAFIRGDALFVNAPGGGEAALTVMGEVPDTASAPSTTVVLAQGWTLVGFAYPVDMALTNSALATVAQNNDRLWWWDPQKGGNGGWDSTTFYTGLGWFPSDVLLKAGEGFFYNATAPLDWTEDVPYDL